MSGSGNGTAIGWSTTPRWQETGGGKILFYFVVVALPLITLIWPLYLWGNVYNFRENGPVEGPQSIYLAIATLLFLLALRRPEPMTRLELCGIALFCFNFLMRETDVRGTWAEHLIGGLFLHGRDFFFIAGLWVPVVGMALARFKETATDLTRWCLSPPGIAMLVGCVLYVVADRAEKHWFFHDPDRSESLEETLELYACYSIFLSGYLTLVLDRFRQAAWRGHRKIS